MPVIPFELALQIASHLDPLSHLVALHAMDVDPVDVVVRTMCRLRAHKYTKLDSVSNSRQLQDTPVKELPGYRVLATCMEAQRACMLTRLMYENADFQDIFIVYAASPDAFALYATPQFEVFSSGNVIASVMRKYMHIFLDLIRDLQTTSMLDEIVSNRIRQASCLFKDDEQSCHGLPISYTPCEGNPCKCSKPMNLRALYPLFLPREVEQIPGFWEMIVMHHKVSEYKSFFYYNDVNVVIDHLLNAGISLTKMFSSTAWREISDPIDASLLPRLDRESLTTLHDQAWGMTADVFWTCRAELEKRYPEQQEERIRIIRQRPSPFPTRMTQKPSPLKVFSPEGCTENKLPRHYVVSFATRLCQDTLFGVVSPRCKAEALLFADESCDKIKDTKTQFFSNMDTSQKEASELMEICCALGDIDVMKILTMKYALVQFEYDPYNFTPAMAEYLVVLNPNTRFLVGALPIMHRLVNGTGDIFSGVDLDAWISCLNSSCALELMRIAARYDKTQNLSRLAEKIYARFQDVGFIEFMVDKEIDDNRSFCNQSVILFRALRHWKGKSSAPGLESISRIDQDTLRGSRDLGLLMSYDGWTPQEMRTVVRWMFPYQEEQSVTLPI